MAWQQGKEGKTYTLCCWHASSIMCMFYLNMPSDVGDVVHYIEHALLACYTHDCDGGIGSGKEKVFFQPQHFSRIGIDDSAMTKHDHALANVVAGNLIHGSDYALAKLFRWLTIFDSIP